MIAKANDEITEDVLKKFDDAGVAEFRTIYTNDLDQGPYIAQTLKSDDTPDQYAAKVAIYRMMRPGEPPTEDAVEALFHGLFFAEERYDLSAVGRMKFNRRVGRNELTGPGTLTNEDIIAVIRILVELRNGRGEIDDIDHLGNRRVRSVGELAENQFRSGLVRVERAVKERLGQAESENLLPHDLINAKPISAAIKEFFGSSQLSQFMDQTNPLSEITHKRRVSALGPGGLTRERAGFEVRDVHPTHYGRVCPIETPEGPNIGLINSLALYARTNEYGFLETPYRKVVDGRVTDEIHFLSAIEEGQYVVAQANAAIDATGKLADELVSCRSHNEFMLSIAGQGPVHGRRAVADRVGGGVADPVPRARRREPRADGLEHAAPGRALPAAGEAAGGHGRRAHRGRRLGHRGDGASRRQGRLHRCVAHRRPRQRRRDGGGRGRRRHLQPREVQAQQPEHQHQPASAGAGGRRESRAATSSPTARRPTWASWRSGRTCWSRSCPGTATTTRTRSSSASAWSADDRYTSIHIEELSVVARDTKLGPEEITRDISSLGESQLGRLDDSGIVYIGAEVEAGDVLVGKVTPKGETQLTPEEKLLRAIFGEKASDVKDTVAARAVGHQRARSSTCRCSRAKASSATSARSRSSRTSSRTTARTSATSCGSSRTTRSRGSRS